MIGGFGGTGSGNWWDGLERYISTCWLLGIVKEGCLRKELSKSNSFRAVPALDAVELNILGTYCRVLPLFQAMSLSDQLPICIHRKLVETELTSARAESKATMRR